MKKLIGFCCSLFLLIGCNSTPKVDIAKETEAIRSLENQWTDVILSKDLDKIVSFTSSDAIFMDINVPTYSGHEAIRKAMGEWLSDTTLNFKTYKFAIDNIEVASSGDLAYVQGHSQVEKKTKNGVAVVKTKFIDIWKKLDGKWTCILNIGNNDYAL